MEKIYCVISHTHWDREWYMPFEKFRIRLVDLIDNLLELVKEYPEFIFHLDAQTIVLEDYLEIRPYKRQELEKYITSGNILVGPWYVQNDFNLTSGEATIRNIIVGSKIAEDMGKCTWVGYAPDQFGLISQLPQIFNGFGINSCIFGRGYNFYENENNEIKPVKMPVEFIWECEDGSKVLAISMPFWYNNAQRFSEDTNKSLKLLEKISNQFEGIALTPYLLLMNGVDHLEVQENLIPVLKSLQEKLPQDQKIKQYTMPEYVSDVENYLKENTNSMDKCCDLRNYIGELRNGVDSQILPGTLSSRIYLKVANVKAQNLLECKLEPIYSFIQSELGCNGMYPNDYMTYLWKLLIHNHPHDSICGCSRDEVHEHMEDIYKKINESGYYLLDRGMEFISSHISRKKIKNNEYIITAFNTHENSRNGLFQVEVQFVADEHINKFEIFDKNNVPVEFKILRKEKKLRDIFGPINLPGLVAVDSYLTEIYVENFDGLSYSTFIVKPVEGCFTDLELNPIISENKNFELENEFIKATVHIDGSVDILYKETNKVYKNIMSLEDSEDIGDEYTFVKSKNNMTLTTDGVIPQIKWTSNSEFKSSCSIVYDWMLPEGYDEESETRCSKLVCNRVEIDLSLKKGYKWMDIRFKVDNKSKNHRMRLLFKHGINSSITEASAPFDIIKKQIKDYTEPNSGLINIENEIEGISILNEGVYEYQQLKENHDTIALTLLRANPWITISDEEISYGETWRVPGNQCLREIELNMAFYPHKGNYIQAEAYSKMREFQNPILVYYQPADIKKFSGGRPAVQESEISEIFFRKDKYSDVNLPLGRAYFDIKGEGVNLSAFKKAEKGEGLIIRVHNIKETETDFRLSYYKDILNCYKVNLKEEREKQLEINGSSIMPIKLKPKEIFTIEIH